MPIEISGGGVSVLIRVSEDRDGVCVFCRVMRAHVLCIGVVGLCSLGVAYRAIPAGLPVFLGYNKL